MDVTIKRSRRLTPTNDYVFKRLFTQRPALLIDLINAICGDRLQVTSLEITNPNILPEDLAGKEIVLDILARDQQGRVFNIEMQVRDHPDWPSRMLYYAANALAGQLKMSEHYGNLKSVIGIHLLDFSLFDDATLAHWRFDLRDPRRPEQALTDVLQLELIELPKVERLLRKANDQATDLPEAFNAWITFFRHAQEDNIMSHIHHEPVRQAQEDLMRMSNNDEEWARAMSRSKAAWDYAAGMDGAKAEGQRNLLTKQLIVRFGALPQSVLDRLSAAKTDQLEAWAEKILFAESLEAVFC